MENKHMQKILGELTREQRAAVLERNRNVLVIAGAGSGKTRTLTARYLTLLSGDSPLDPSQIAAITFTEKAAREMKSRISAQIRNLADAAESEDDREHWYKQLSNMDSAQIGTIHGFCAHLLRLQPVEADIDPGFEVLDEGQSALLKSSLIQQVISTISQDPRYELLFRYIGTRNIENVLMRVLENSNERIVRADIPFEMRLRAMLLDMYESDPIKGFLEKYEAAPAEAIDTECASKEDYTAPRVHKLYQTLTSVREEARTGSDGFSCIESVYIPFCDWNFSKGAKSGYWSKTAREIREVLLDNFVWLKGDGKEYCSPEQYAEYEQMIGLLYGLADPLQENYQGLLFANHALDFDSLESKTAEILETCPNVREKWAEQYQAILVDEFQDTNERQSKIFNALADRNGKLFRVGDKKQSIYRFRGADVTQFTEAEKEDGIRSIRLDVNYRTHAELLDGMGCILEKMMGTETDKTQGSTYVGYEPLTSGRDLSINAIRGKSPYIEVISAKTKKEKNSEEKQPHSGREIAAQMLAARLRELHDTENIEYGDVALLFRASGGFPDYEKALEQFGIPYITIAGSGFYDRPEIRDVLNMLRAVSNPSDDLALTGFLLSPVIGCSLSLPVSLSQKSRESDPPQPMWDILKSEESDDPTVRRAVKIFETLSLAAGRCTVSDLIEQLYSLTDYRAAAALSDGERVWRNLDKLLEDARSSKLTTVSDFLIWLDAVSTTGIREGEAASDNQGAVQLMTIHKSKGLEFPVVVLCDAGRSDNNFSPEVLIDPLLGLTVATKPKNAIHSLACRRDQMHEAWEKLRLLYVALTRAQDKLIINGGKDAGWLGDLYQYFPEIKTICTAQGEIPPQEVKIDGKYPVRVAASGCYTDLPVIAGPKRSDNANSEDLSPITEPIVTTKNKMCLKIMHQEELVGTMVHKALELWRFTGNRYLFESMVKRYSQFSEDEQYDMIDRAETLLSRFRESELYREIEAADAVYHELPYSLPGGKNRIIDCLYRKGTDWTVADFKTDAIDSAEKRTERRKEYTKQVNEYRSAVNQILGVRCKAILCFLDDMGKAVIY